MNTTDHGKLVLRLSVGGMMLLHGIAKLTNPGSLDWINGEVAGMGLPFFLGYAVLIGEILAPLMVVAGVKARIGGWLMVANMVVAIYLAHMSELFALTKNGGWAIELQALYLFGSLTIALQGSGRYAVKPD